MTIASEQIQNRGQRLQALTQTAADTGMGKLLRRFWMPIALSRKLAIGAALPVRIFNEDLTLYRGASGQPHLVGGRCAHRSTLLHTGWVCGEAIRCIYHGWEYDSSGACTNRPAERDSSAPTVRIAGYPCHEYAGLVFAYLGPGAPPDFDLPRKDVFEEPGRIIYTHQELWNCNWLQMVENSMDAVHVSFVHQKERSGEFGAAVTVNLPELSYVETDAGIQQTADRGAGNIRVSDWAFPNSNHVNVPGLQRNHQWIDVGQWNTPIDDEHTLKINLWSTPSQGPEIDAIILKYFDEVVEYDPSEHHDELMKGIYPDDVLFRLAAAQDYVAQIGQGTITDRETETLGRSDAGIAFLRRLYFREIEAIVSGGQPKTWKRLGESVKLPLQQSTV